ncbi:MAG: hypothetical protein OEW04_06915 [Nitrospirota bacterium]|nr:hypothetical protein [Nitrospirota bacterium]
MKRSLIATVLLFVMAGAANAQMGMMAEGKGGMMGGMAANEPPSKKEPNSSAQKTQEKAETGVTVEVVLQGQNAALTFKVTLDTHSVELDKYKFAEIVVLRADGKEYKGSVKPKEGSGHHRSAVIEFENPKTKEIAIVVKDVAGVKERVFKF